MLEISTITTTIKKSATWKSTTHMAGENPTYWYPGLRPKPKKAEQHPTKMPLIICSDKDARGAQPASGIGSKLNKLIN